MLWTVTIATFLATGIVVSALIYAFSSSRGAVAQRLGELNVAGTRTVEKGFREQQRERTQKLLEKLGKLVPSGSKDESRTRRMLIRAGYRGSDTIYMMHASKVILPLVLVGGLWSSGLIWMNPVFLSIAGILVGFLGPEFWLTWRVRARQRLIRLGLPDALDLLVVCVEAGLGLDQAMLRVAEEIQIVHPRLSEELQIVILEMRMGKSRVEALRELSARTGVEEIKALATMLIQTDRFGTSVAQSLRVHSDNLRTRRRQRAEEMAAKTTVKMVGPLVFFIFPALFLVIFGPAVISIMRTLLPEMGR
jgi:tight adherence protein C